MQKWFSTCLLLCAIGLLKELRPSEPFITEFLSGPWKNLTINQLVQDVYPVWTYSYLAVLIVVFIITHYVLYKPVVILEGVCYILTWCLLIWGHGVPAMQGVEFFYAAATATRVAYTTYIYTQVPTERFQLVTAYTKAALLTGRCLAGVLGQVLITTGVCDFSTLNYISLAFVSTATVVACFLPSVSQSIYFHRRSTNYPPDNPPQIPRARNDVAGKMLSLEQMDLEAKEAKRGALYLLWLDFTSTFSCSYMLKWSFWWAAAMCGYFQVVNYIQTLWETISPTAASGQDDHSVYNGGVQALHTLLSALATLGIGYVRVDWSVYGEAVIALISVLEGVMLYVAGTTEYLWVAYVTYIIFCVSYSVLITIASSEVAKGLKRESYGLVFGFNTFLALFFQTILTLVVADDVGLALDPRLQFKVYGGYYLVLGAAFLSIATYSRLCSQKATQNGSPNSREDN